MAAPMLLSAPALAVLVIGLAVAEGVLHWLGRRGILPWLRERTGRSLSATAFDEYTTIFLGSKRVELDQRQEALMLRQDADAGAPPRNGIDLANGIALIRRPADRPGTADR